MKLTYELMSQIQDRGKFLSVKLTMMFITHPPMENVRMKFDEANFQPCNFQFSSSCDIECFWCSIRQYSSKEFQTVTKQDLHELAFQEISNLFNLLYLILRSIKLHGLKLHLTTFRLPGNSLLKKKQLVRIGGASPLIAKLK